MPQDDPAQSGADQGQQGYGSYQGYDQSQQAYGSYQGYDQSQQGYGSYQGYDQNQQAYNQGQQGYGSYQGYDQSQQAYGSYPPPPYVQGITNPDSESARTSGIIGLVIGILTALSTCFVVGVPTAIMSGIAIGQASGTPDSAKRLARNSWIVYGINWAVVVLGFAAWVAIMIATTE